MYVLSYWHYQCSQTQALGEAPWDDQQFRLAACFGQMSLDSRHYCFEDENQVAGIANAELAIPLRAVRGCCVPALNLQAKAATRTE